MDKSIFNGLIQNTAILFMIAVVFTSFGYRWLKTERFWPKIFLGIIIGAISILIMNSPWYFNQGLFTDARSVVLSLTGLFFGFIPTAIAMLISAVYRFSVGGSYITGITLILVTGSIGLIWRRFMKKPLIDLEWWRILIFGVTVHLLMIAVMFTQPIEIAVPFFLETSIPNLTIYPAATLVLGLLMRNYLRNNQASVDLQKNREQLKSIVNILQYPSEEVQSFIDYSMEEAIKLTESQLGFIFHYSEETKLFTLSAWSKIAVALCQIPEPQVVYELDKTGIWGEPIRQRKPIIINDFIGENPLKKGYPQGHPPIKRLLEIPVFVEDKIVAVVGMANKETEYTETDVSQLVILMDTIWKTTERKKAVEDLKISEENYRLLFNQSVDGIFLLSKDGSHLEINDSGCKMLGYDRQELSKNFYSIISQAADGKHRDEGDGDQLDLFEAIKLHPLISQRKLLTKNKEEIDVEIFTQQLSDGRIQKVVRNITERKKTEAEINRAQKELHRLLKASDDSRKALLSVIEDQKIVEDALRKSEKSYRNLFENITQGFALHKIVLDNNGIPIDFEYLAANPAFEELTGLKIKEILGRNATDILPGMPRSWFKTYGEVALTGKPIRFEDYSARIDKYFDMLAFCPDLGYFAVVITDITERKKYELEIQNFNAELENRVKLRTEELETANRELESFSYSVSHDLRAPLRAINGFSQILLEDYADSFSGEVKHYFDLIQENSATMGNLVDDLLNFSRLGRQALNLVVVKPKKLVEEILKSMEIEIINRNVSINILPMPSCKADGALLKQVYVNLISNAIKFSRNQQNPRVEIGSIKNYVNETGIESAPSGVSCYYVKDNGVGFNMKFYDKLFGVFHRLHKAEEYEGTGVGLAIVDRIIKKHDGQIWAESAEGKGTTFYFTLGESKNG